MKVSYLELYAHCKKTLKGIGVSYGCAEDGAEAIAWGEFCGLRSYEQYANEVQNTTVSVNEAVKIIEREEGYICLDGQGQSSASVGRLIVEYARTQTQREFDFTIHVKNTIPSTILASHVHYLSRKGKSNILRYTDIKGESVGIFATSEMDYPWVVSGEVNGKRIENQLLKWRPQQIITCKSHSEYKLFIVPKEVVHQLMDACRKEISSQVKTSSDLQRNWEKSHVEGRTISKEIWKALEKIGANTLVESTELSRLRGAGELA